MHGTSDGVLGREPITDDDSVYVPARPWPEEEHPKIVLEVRQLTTGEYAGLAYTSVEHLVAALGEHQPWIRLPFGQLQAELARVGVREIYVDAQLPDDAWRWDAAGIETVAWGRG